MLRLIYAAVVFCVSNFVVACAPVDRMPPPEILAIEKPAQAFKAQREMALLYIMSSRTTDTGLTASMRINDEDALLGANLTGRFFVFCLLPGTHNVRYGSQREVLVVKAGDIVVRDVLVYFNPLFLGHPVEARAIENAYAAPMIAERSIGSNFAYRETKYRCRNLD